jgi:Tfp pilus assembly protein PilN
VPRNRVVIEVSATRLEVTALSPRGPHQSKSRRLDLPSGPDAWSEAIASTSVHLKEMLGTLGASGARGTIVYHAPSTAVGVFSCPTSAGVAGARQAALLSLAEAANFALDANPVDARTLCQDPPDEKEASAPQTHTLVAGDTEETLAQLAAWAGAAGIVVDRIIPVDGALMEHAVAAAVELAGDSGTSLVLHVGEQTSILASCDRRRLRFVRQIGMGTESLVRALTQGVRPESASAQGISLDPAQAQELLFTIGIPRREQVVSGPKGDIRGDQMLPLLQPCLQRAVLEIRQSLRFGLSEQGRKDLSLVVRGAGARVPRLGDVIAEQVGLAVAPAPEKPAESQCSPFSCAEGVTRAGWRGAELQPRAVRARAFTDRAKRGVLIGAAAALVLIVGQTAMLRLQLSNARRTLALEQASAQTIRPLVAAQRQVRSTNIALTAARARLRDRFAVWPRFDAVLAFLAQQTPEGVRLSEVAMALDSTGKPIARFQGRTVNPAKFDGNDSIKRFLDALSAAPMFKAARLGSTQRMQSPEGVTLTFDISANLVEVPAEDADLGIAAPHAPNASATQNGATP